MWENLICPSNYMNYTPFISWCWWCFIHGTLPLVSLDLCIRITGLHFQKWGTVSIDSLPIIKIHFQCLRDKARALNHANWPRGGGAVAWKMYTPARTASQNPYPYWHKICKLPGNELPRSCFIFSFQSAPPEDLKWNSPKSYHTVWDFLPKLNAHYTYPL